jgi:hypothetical protein
MAGAITTPAHRPAFEDLLRTIFPGIVIDLPEEKVQYWSELARQKKFQEKLDQVKLEEVEGYQDVVFNTSSFKIN